MKRVRRRLRFSGRIPGVPRVRLVINARPDVAELIIDYARAEHCTRSSLLNELIEYAVADDLLDADTNGHKKGG